MKKIYISGKISTKPFIGLKRCDREGVFKLLTEKSVKLLTIKLLTNIYIKMQQKNSNYSLQDGSKSEKFNETPQVIAQIQQVDERKSKHFDDVGNKNGSTETNGNEEELSAVRKKKEDYENREKELLRMRDEKTKKEFDRIKF
ncbi:hypothetical protein [Candidatus Fokinia crypta]|uniref:Uncharacterized protein n=1 Tax=Candidatus Fokinia crypta TaxID=1920990 RepID=A0ABZ0UQL8_9RICK|nr:hypothetical protein [Candidatus Fokinia cryptica]WPX97999.1 hypothetical protein Fokcrypt_00526 [Candidatus Fokinia cryptica]